MDEIAILGGIPDGEFAPEGDLKNGEAGRWDEMIANQVREYDPQNQLILLVQRSNGAEELLPNRTLSLWTTLHPNPPIRTALTPSALQSQGPEVAGKAPDHAGASGASGDAIGLLTRLSYPL